MAAGVKIDHQGITIDIRPDNMVTIDGVCLGKRVIRGGHVYLQVKDGSRLRSTGRGTDLIEVPLDILALKMAES